MIQVCPYYQTVIPQRNLNTNLLQAATEKVMTKDGWFKSGDMGTVDREGFLYIKDRREYVRSLKAFFA